MLEQPDTLFATRCAGPRRRAAGSAPGARAAVASVHRPKARKSPPAAASGERLERARRAASSRPARSAIGKRDAELVAQGGERARGNAPARPTAAPRPAPVGRGRQTRDRAAGTRERRVAASRRAARTPRARSAARGRARAQRLEPRAQRRNVRVPDVRVAAHAARARAAPAADTASGTRRRRRRDAHAVELGEAAAVGDPLAREQSAHHSECLVEALDAFRGRRLGQPDRARCAAARRRRTDSPACRRRAPARWRGCAPAAPGSRSARSGSSRSRARSWRAATAAASAVGS